MAQKDLLGTINMKVNRKLGILEDERVGIERNTVDKKQKRIGDSR